MFTHCPLEHVYDEGRVADDFASLLALPTNTFIFQTIQTFYGKPHLPPALPLVMPDHPASVLLLSRAPDSSAPAKGEKWVLLEIAAHCPKMSNFGVFFLFFEVLKNWWSTQFRTQQTS